jgi:uncharacterized protein YaeQ
VTGPRGAPPGAKRAGEEAPSSAWASRLASARVLGHDSGMALPATLHTFDLRFSRADEGVEGEAALKVARHPSETMERVWLRVLAYAWKWRDGIAFGPGLCEPDAPDLHAPAPGGRSALLVRVGRPEPARVERDVNQNPGAEVAVLFDGARRLAAFLAEARERGLARAAAADLAAVDGPLLAELAAVDERRIRLVVTLVADHLYLEVNGRALEGPLHRAGS